MQNLLALLSEKKKEFPAALEGYIQCLQSCNGLAETLHSDSNNIGVMVPSRLNSVDGSEGGREMVISFIRDLRGEIMLRIAIIRKEIGAVDEAMQMCNSIASEQPLNDVVRANALCLKVFN